MSSTNCKKSLECFALVDCNNFFVSCERLFDPKLHHKPVVVLSSNDGCIVARSNEAKALGIPMGAPFFQWADFMQRHKVRYLSSNFALYADLSDRVMQTLCYFHPELEVYSIDEAFLFLQDREDPLAYCSKLREEVVRWTGIPLSVGIAPTKTLAKVAGRVAKKGSGVYGILDSVTKEKILSNLSVGEVWGIGKRMTATLSRLRINSAQEFLSQEDEWIRKHFSVMALRTAWELRGIPCLALEEAPSAKKSLMTSRSFGKAVREKEVVEQAISSYTSRGAEKLREEGCRATFIDLFIMTSPHKENYYSNHAHLVLPEPTNYTPELLHFAKKGVDLIFRPGYAYKRAGVLLGELVEEKSYQKDLFVLQNKGQEERKQAVMEMVDRANRRFGYGILHFGMTDKEELWKSRSESTSAAYSTSWDELLTIKI